ncbi:hypothetical protein E2C01_034235 [Portunus trituberculatus]|uniref:Uncharacterized protein n=1 Tax=Portunus trituberculatus TaxID=210409 RepID=A0A5B7F011_PORTR|nr:hypothetical protein [Portunus trituberculatus]
MPERQPCRSNNRTPPRCQQDRNGRNAAQRFRWSCVTMGSFTHPMFPACYEWKTHIFSFLIKNFMMSSVIER